MGETFQQKLLGVGISWQPVAILGFILWAGTLSFYTLTLRHVLGAEEQERFAFEASLWWFVVLMHVGVGILVFVESYFSRFGGRVWVLQWLIMSLAATITALVATGFTLALVRRGNLVGFDSNLSFEEDARVTFSGLSIITSLLGDALLLSVLFAYFQRRFDSLQSRSSQRVYAGYSPSTGSRYIYTK